MSLTRKAEWPLWPLRGQDGIFQMAKAEQPACLASFLTSNGLGLFKNHLLCYASFSLIQLLSNAGNDTKALS